MSLTRIGSIGINTGIAFAGVTTIVTLNTANDALSIGATVNVGSGITLGASGDGFFTGVVTATSYVGDGSALTGIAATDNVRTGILDVAGVGTFRNDVNIPDKIVHLGDTDTAIRFPSANTVSVEAAGVQKLSLSTSEVVFNDTGIDCDFRIEGDSNANLVKVDAGNDRVGVGVASPQQVFHVYHASDNGLALFESGDANCRIDLKDNSGQVSVEAVGDSLRFGTSSSNTERLRIDSSGRLLLNATTEGNAGADDFTIGQLSGSTGITIRSGTTNNGNLYFSDGTSGDDEYRGSIQYQHANNSLHIATNAVERLIIKSDGKVGVGNASPTFLLDVKGATTDTFRISNSNESSHGDVDAKIVAGGSYYQNIRSEASNHKFITFDGSSTYERLRITSAGAVLIGDTTATSQNDRLLQIGKTDRGATYLELRTSTSGAGGIVFSDGTAADSTGYRGTFEYVHSSDYMIFKTAATERLRIHSNGTMSFLNTTFPYSEHFHFYAGITSKPGMSIYYGTDSDESALIMRHGRAGANSGAWTGKFIQFRSSDNNERGSVTGGSSSVSFNTSSDYRLKENEVTISDAISKVKQLKPYTFNFKVTPDQKVDGFFAHEAQEVVSYAVTGEKDAEDMQQMDYGKLTPLLTAALQEAITEIESLKAEVAALKSS